MIEFEYLDKSCPPNGEWKIKVPKTGTVFKHYDYSTIKKSYTKHCNANGIFLSPTWEEEFISEMCKQNKWDGCRKLTEKKIVRRKLSLTAVLSFLNMMKAWAESTLSGKAAFVSQEEAEKRADACASCQFNVGLHFSCGACMGAVLKLIHGILGKRKTSLDDRLGACMICSCSLKAAVHVPLEVQLKGLPPELQEEFKKIKDCWKHEVQ
jgi:hypothetical protein